ncbi:TPA: tail fiber assembly protein [Salmonella enterica subsp. enterica serovar Montevideo]|nr:tail fiber assembly protein [Salmonella enterica subsp. enterica serovar Montevideo]EEF6737139.1 tail fiber assembly protein [Salmonella enterica]EED6080888.1 tail fiber assembly protein [Salmonella enterica subsp. enterica serovar Montevideo]HEB3030255.1 tail fiber assembly protein [Salmonella enterica subsp. enterica serovar Montevideo]HEB3069953.1 tail fiber assembly protein [Salmonella enterica subsp. enterica serovar Montevideo]
MSQAELNSELIAIVAGEITVFNFDGETREYLSESVEILSVGVGIPANSCIDAPGNKKEGFVICRTANFTAWEYVMDHRGETVYSTETGETDVISMLGDYPEKTTIIAPVTPYDTWDGNKWVTDANAQHLADVASAEADKQSRIDKANDYINSKQWPGKAAIGRLKVDELAHYNLWLDYLDALEAVDTSSAPDIKWPTPPALLGG